MYINTPSFPLSHRPEAIQKSHEINNMTNITINDDNVALTVNNKNQFNMADYNKMIKTRKLKTANL